MERDGLAMPAPGFSISSVIFDTVSAFRAVGLSTGVPYDSYSFCGAWYTVRKLILVVVMIRSRYRGLPMAIDRAVLIPGQELMQRMDREYNRAGTGKPHLKEEQEQVRAEAGSPAEGQDPEQDEATAEKMHQDESEKDIAQTS